MTAFKIDEAIQQQFPASMFSGADEHTMILLYRAYSCGYKDGYSKRNPDATIEVKRNPTLGELLHATQQERIKDSSSDGKVLR